MEKHVLSKSTFMRGIKCPKSLYLNKHKRRLGIESDAYSAQAMAIFDQGTNVGELATQLFPGGVDCTPESYYDFQKAVEQTQQEIENGATVIYEAAFQFEGVLAAVDILVKDEDGWKAYEVKSSTSVSDTYRMDGTLQYYVITKSGIDLKDFSITYINNQYSRNGAINVHQLFVSESIMTDINKRLAGLPNQINLFKKILLQDAIPEKEIGVHCNSPYGCDFAGHCWKNIPNYSVFNISGLHETKKFELYNSGAITFDQIPKDFNLSDNKWMQIDCELENKIVIDKASIQHFLSELKYPLYYLDFETIGPAVPIFDNTRPYRQYVFQYSLHTQNTKGANVKHKESLAETDGTDPRRNFCKQLIEECGTSGDVLVYNIGFERGKLDDLCTVFPEYAKDLKGIISRLKDLATPFQKKWYYTPEMKGKYSIKNVLPALVPHLSYGDLEIQEGGTASNLFAQMASGNFDGDIETARKNLIDYCKLDTLAMVEILAVLYKL